MLTPANVFNASCNAAIPDFSILSLPRREDGLEEEADGFLSPVTAEAARVSSGTVQAAWPGQLTSETVGREGWVTEAGVRAGAGAVSQVVMGAATTVVSEVTVRNAAAAVSEAAVGTAAYKSAYESQAPMRTNANDKGKRIIQLADLTPGPWVLQC